MRFHMVQKYAHRAILGFLVSPIFDKFLLDYGRIPCLQRSQASSPLSATATSRKFEFGLSRCPQFSNLPLGPQQPPKWPQPHQPILDLPYTPPHLLPFFLSPFADTCVENTGPPCAVHGHRRITLPNKVQGPEAQDCRRRGRKRYPHPKNRSSEAKYCPDEIGTGALA